MSSRILHRGKIILPHTNDFKEGGHTSLVITPNRRNMAYR